MIRIACVAMLATITPVNAQTLYLTAERLIDPVSGRVIESPALLIDGGKIVAAGASASLTVPAGTPAIDLADKTLLPGFIDMHTHLTYSATKGRGWEGLGLQRERQVIWGVASARKTLMAIL